MVVLVALSLIGAVLGAVIRPRFASVPVAVGLALATRWAIGLAGAHALDSAGGSFWEVWALSAVADPLDDYLSLPAAAGGAALIAAALVLVFDRQRPQDFTISDVTRPARTVRHGRFLRAEGMIEERPVQAKAEQRHKAVLGL